MADMTNTAVTALMAQLQAALGRRDRAETNRLVGALLAGNAPLGAQWHGIARLMQISGEWTLALGASDAFIASAADRHAAQYSKVVLLTQAHRLQEAHDLLARLPADVPDRCGHAYVMGNTAMTLGRIDEARAHLLEALRHRPGWGPAWLSLATAGSLAGAGIGDRMLAEADVAERQGPADLARYCYALGKLHADRGEAGSAFAAFARGAALLKAQMPYSHAADAANASEAMTGYDNGLIERARQSARADTSRPIFVTGLPRSGTTLVEQILASHSAVLDGGELNLIQHAAVAAGGVSATALERHFAQGGTADALGALYLHLLDERFGPAGRIVDKTIDASRYMGVIATALPDAPLIRMRRDPLDAAWSCFRTFFIHGVAWSFDFADIARHFLLEDRLMAYWQRVLGERLLVVPFDALVTDPAAWTERLLAHCKLPREEGPFVPHLTQRRVATASALQVRRPINREGIGVAAPYRAHMQRFVDIYGGKAG